MPFCQLSIRVGTAPGERGNGGTGRGTARMRGLVRRRYKAGGASPSSVSAVVLFLWCVSGFGVKRVVGKDLIGKLRRACVGHRGRQAGWLAGCSSNCVQFTLLFRHSYFRHQVSVTIAPAPRKAIVTGHNWKQPPRCSLAPSVVANGRNCPACVRTGGRVRVSFSFCSCNLVPGGGGKIGCHVMADNG